VHQLACALVRAGCQVHVLYSKEPDEKISPNVPYKIHWVRRFNVQTINLDIFSFGLALNRLAGKEKFDVIHGNAEEAFFSACTCRRHNAVPFFTSHAPHVPTTGILRALCRPVAFLKTVNPYLQRGTLSRARKIITFSEFSRTLVLAGLGQNFQERVEVIAGGIDPSWFEVKRTPAEKPELIFWGRMEDEKGVPELLQALALVAKKIPTIKLTLVGEGSRLEDYKQQVRKLGLIPKIIMPGWRSIEEIQQLVARARVAVLPSRIESFGLSAAEAQGAGVPVVATHAGALKEIVEDGVTGTLVEAEDPKALADAIFLVLGNEEKFRLMAEAGRESARQKFSWDLTAQKLIALYQQELQAP
jgi:glycosyltransferase involved in cell wall biosynthesis